MRPILSRLLLVSAFALVIVGPASAQEKTDEDYRRFFKKPENAAEFWEAIQFELDVGRFDLAARLIQEMVDKKPTAEELLNLHEKEGIAKFLRLRLVSRWSTNLDLDRKTRQNVNVLIDAITRAVKDRLGDPKRIKVFVKNLLGEPEEKAYAEIELAKSGAVVVPYIVEELRATSLRERGPIVDALTKLGPDTVPPLLAALDVDDDPTRENIIDALKARGDFTLLKERGVDPAPFLWPLTTPQVKSRALRDKAGEALRVLYGLKSASQLGPAKVALTEEAERYYDGRQIRYPDPNKVAVWRWEGDKLVEDSKYTAQSAKEYYGLRFARQALAIDPTYRPAQVVFASLVIDRGFTPPTAERPVGSLKPSVIDLLGKVNTELLMAVLEQALRDQRTLVVLGVVQALGNLGDPRALMPTEKGEPALVRALDYGDRRVQMAAADALLRIPGSRSAQASARIVQVLSQALAPDAAASARPRVLVALTDLTFRQQTGAALQEIGAESILVATGRDALRRLKDKADIDAILTDSTLPHPGMPYLLAQLRQDGDVGLLPVFLAPLPDTREARAVVERVQLVKAQTAALDRDIKTRVERAVKDYSRLDEGGFALQRDIIVEDLRRKRKELDELLLSLSQRYERETATRVAALERFTEKYANVFVVSPGQFNDPRGLQVLLEDRLREVGMPPLTKAERKAHAELALAWLAKLAAGEVAGYDVKTAQTAVLDVFTAPPLSDEAMMNALRVAGRLSGPRPQKELIAVVLDAARPAKVRAVAAEELQRNLVTHGQPDAAQTAALKTGLARALSQEKLDEALKERLTRLVGSLRPDARNTGRELRDFKP